MLAPIRTLRPDLPACTRAVVHANAAIAAALRNDAAIATMLRALRAGNLFEVEQLGGAVQATAATAGTEIVRLRELARDPDFPNGPGLTGFAAVLESALDRQGKLGTDLAAFTAGDGSRLQTRQIGEYGLRGNAPAVFGPNSSRLSEILGSDSNDAGSMPTWTARRVADDVANRLPGIASDESRAAERAMGAMSGC